MADVDKSLPGDQPLPLDEFFEEDEPVEKVVAAFEAGERGYTAPTFKAGGTVFRFRYTRRAWGEYLVQVFVGEEVGRLQNAGSFTLKHDEMQNFLVNLGMLAAARNQIGLPADGWWPEDVTDAS